MRWRCASVFAVAGLLGSLIGAHLAKQVAGEDLILWFAVAMAAVGGSMLVPRKGAGDPFVTLTPALTARLAPLGLLVGLAAGFFGGFLIVPGLMAATGMTMAHAAASSLVSVVLFGAATSASYAASDQIDWEVFLALVAGGGFGALAGGHLARILADRATLARQLFALFVIATAAYVAARALHILG